VRILLIDDDQQVRETLAAFLQRAGHEVQALGEARQLRSTLQARPDIAFVDVYMPDVDGFQVLAQLRAAYPGMPVVMISGAAPNLATCLPMATRLGAEAVLQKPVTMHALLDAVDTLTTPMR
jgi:two-component system OmpR family response regulator